MVNARRRITLIGVLLVAAVALATGATVGRLYVRGICWMLGFGESTYYGWHTNLLHPGDDVAVAEDFRAAPADQVLHRKGDGYDWPGMTPAGDILVARGSRGTVKIEPAWDEDSCDPDRPIAVQLVSGPIVALPRHILRR
jgi:hypothetical protein